MSYSTRAASCSSACAVASFSLPLKSSLNSVFIASPNTLKVKVYFYIISSQALMRNKLVSLKKQNTYSNALIRMRIYIQTCTKK